MSDEFWRAENGFRKDPIDQEWTLIARNRRVVPPRSGPRPIEGPAPDPLDARAAAARLPHLGERQNGQAHVKAVPSPTPLVFVEQQPPALTPFIESGALGAHELLILAGAPKDMQVANIDANAFGALFELWAERAHDLAKDLRLQRVGLSLPPVAGRRSPLCAAHLLALPLAPQHPPQVADACVVCAAIKAAQEGGRLVDQREGALSFVPFAPRGAAHVRVVASDHGALLADASGRVAAAMGTQVAGAAAALARVFETTDLAVEIAPVTLRVSPGQAVHVVIDVVASADVDAVAFAQQGVRVCPIPPEDLAAELRSALAAHLVDVG